MSHVIAGLIQRSTAEQKILEYNREMERKVDERALELRRNYEIQTATNEILAIANDSLPLAAKLDQIMRSLIQIPWLALDAKGAIFTADPPNRMLTMVSHYGMIDETTRCRQVPFGCCICGQAAERQELVFKSDIDEDHHIYLPSGKPHGHYCVPLLFDREVLGVVNLYTHAGHQTVTMERDFLLTAANTLAATIKRHQAEEQLDTLSQHLAKTLNATVMALSHTAETRDPYTAGHQRRVATLAQRIGERMEWTPDRLESLRLAGVLHDIGKITVPAEILAKPGKLTAAEFEIIKTHSEVGYEILRPIHFAAPIAEIVHQHHEKLDGSGYPRQLRGDEIHPEAKVLAVADVMEALASHRPYRPSMGLDKALAILQDGRGKQFCPHAVDACLEIIEEHADFEAIFAQDANHFH
ncbi:MAG: HD domain-containing protein [Magnetococcales bacterium]|nr:HD domain-containing protein [Magnetococcales bacterium]